MRRLVAYIEVPEPVGVMKMHVDNVPEDAEVTYDAEKGLLYVISPDVFPRMFQADYWEWEETDVDA